MELNDLDAQVFFKDDKEKSQDKDDSLVCSELPLAERISLKIQDIADQSNKDDTMRIEPGRCKLKATVQEEGIHAVDAFNSWLSETFEKKENNGMVISMEMKGKQTENELKRGPDHTNAEDKCNDEFNGIKIQHQCHEIDKSHKHDKLKTDKNDCLASVPGSPIFLKNPSSFSKMGTRKSKRKAAVSGHKRRHIDIEVIDDDVYKSQHRSDNQIENSDVNIHRPQKLIPGKIQIPPDQEDIIEIYSPFNEGSPRRGRTREHAVSRNRRAKKSKPSPGSLPCTPGGTFGRPASPATMLLLNQLEDDEKMARRLQEEFDAERVANSQLSVIQHGPPQLPSFEPQATVSHRPRANSRHNQRYPMLEHQAAAYSNAAWANYTPTFDEFYRPVHHQLLQNYINMINTPPRQRGRGRRRNRIRYPHELDEEENGNNYETLMALAERLGPAIEKGLSAIEISQLPTFLYTPDCKLHNRSCSICMADYETGDNLRKLPCFHDYHDTCIDQWLVKNPACPICRVEVQI